MCLVTYNMGQGGSRNPALWSQMLPDLQPDLLFVQESRNPLSFQLLTQGAGKPTGAGSWLWSVVPGRKWGSGIWARGAALTPLPVPDDFAGRVVAAVVHDRCWPGSGKVDVVAVNIHAPTRTGSSYLKEVGRILDFVGPLSAGRPLLLAGDFNVVMGMRADGQKPRVSAGEVSLLNRLRECYDLVPCWQTAHPGEPLARTLRWLRRKDSLPYHCDGFLVPSAWAGAIRACDVLETDDWCLLSDHNPVVALLNVAPT